MNLYSQEIVKWDDTQSKDWPKECRLVNIISTSDGKNQPAFFFAMRGVKPAPLIVSLHTWSGDYTQKDSLAWQCIKKGYNYIHPNFRGPNNTYEACGSSLVISDIDGAIDFALKNSSVDTSEIHIIGVSGGGYATMLMYMKSRHNIKTFSAWAGISNLLDWYYESEGRKNRYSKDIAQATTGKNFGSGNYNMDREEAKKRSPVFMETPVAERKNGKLYIYEGVHDGYTGSVPITHSINFYNKVVSDFNGTEKNAIIPENEIIQLVTYRCFPGETKLNLGDRKIHYQKTYSDKVKITLFEGGHEMLTNVALDHIKSKKILAIGDSNGEFDFGWVNQLKQLRFEDKIVNTSISGNTIGFDNLGNQKLNTLKNVDSYLEKAIQEIHGVDVILVMLGTNDCKAIFADSLEIVPENMQKLISEIKTNPVYKKYNPEIYIISPPPFGPDKMLTEKYFGGNERIKFLQPKFREIAEKNGCIFIDSFTKIKDAFEYLTLDGIHLTTEGQKLVANIINNQLENKKALSN